MDQPSPNAVDQLPLIHKLIEDNQRWRRRFLGACVAFGVLGLVSLVQFGSTWTVCQMMNELRQDKRELTELMRDVQAARADSQKVLSWGEDLEHTIRSLKVIEEEYSKVRANVQDGELDWVRMLITNRTNVEAATRGYHDLLLQKYEELENLQAEQVALLQLLKEVRQDVLELYDEKEDWKLAPHSPKHPSACLFPKSMAQTRRATGGE